MAEGSARFVARFGLIPGQEFRLEARPLILGREPLNDIPLKDPEVSRRHARLTPQSDSFLIEDLGSTNGTFVNGRRITTPTLLKHGDVVDFGETVSLIFVQAGRPVPEGQLANLAPTLLDVESPLAVEAGVATEVAAAPSADDQKSQTRRRVMVGCGCLLAAVFFCAGLLFFLDSYREGALLYCGPLESLLRPLVELSGQLLQCP
ncbi:MAG: FHA domain-containing protein [Chloroflexota bacterium]